jgi:hypothetical protein
MPMAVKPMATASPYVLSAQDGKSAFEIVAQACKSVESNLFEDESMSNTQKLSRLISILQDYVADATPAHATMKCLPHQAFYVKQLLDPVMEYHGLTSEVRDDGVHIFGNFSNDAIDALRRCEKSIKVAIKSKSLN